MNLRTVELNVTSQQVLIPCAVGAKIRIVAIVGSIAVGGDGDQIIVEFRRGATPVARASSNPLTLATNDMAAAIGLDAFNAMLESTTVATGVANYSASTTTAQMALPDITFDFEVTLLVTTKTGSASQATILYEEHTTTKERKKVR